MANSKISALTSATTPLAGTETLPVVQSGVTKQVSVANLTAGRAISASSLTLTTALTVGNGGTGTGTAFTAGSVIFAGASGIYSQNNSRFFWDDTNVRLGIGTASPSVSIHVLTSGAEIRVQNTTTGSAPISFRNSNSSVLPLPSIGTVSGDDLQLIAGGAVRAEVQSGGDFKFNTGNLIQGTAAKGINFAANTPAAGMTSRLLNWYEEGTWTPTIRFSGGSTGVTYSSQAGTYTRIGRQVTLNFDVRLSNKGSSTGVWEIGGFPFTAGAEGHGNLHYQSGGAGINQLANIRITSGSTYGGLYYASAGSTLNYAETDATNTSICIGQVTYFV